MYPPTPAPLGLFALMMLGEPCPQPLRIRPMHRLGAWGVSVHVQLGLRLRWHHLPCRFALLPECDPPWNPCAFYSLLGSSDLYGRTFLEQTNTPPLYISSHVSTPAILPLYPTLFNDHLVGCGVKDYPLLIECDVCIC